MALSFTGSARAFGEVLHKTLDSQTAVRCSRFIQKYRIMGEPVPGPYSFAHTPWVEKPHDDNSEKIVIMKGAQLGWTEFSINRMIFTLDQLRRDTAYILPIERPTAVRFSKGRLNKICEMSPYFSDFFQKGNNETHKMTKFSNNLYINGANSRTGLKEYSAGLVVLDELDEMSFESVRLAEERLSGYPEGKRQLIMLSTPGQEELGIHSQFLVSTQAKYMFKCPYCSKFISFEYPQSVVITADSVTDEKINNSYYICYECKHRIDQKEKKELYKTAVWVDQKTSPIKGYHVSQLYSLSLGPEKIAQAEVSGRYNIAYKTEFYNSKLGLPFVHEGSNVTEKDINESTKSYLNNDFKQKKDLIVTIGIDVGQQNHHVSVVGWYLDANKGTKDITVASVGKLLYHGTVESFEDAAKLMNKWQPNRVVIDAQPLAQEAKALCKRFMGLAFVCYYSKTKTANEIQLGNVNECSISVNRTFWLDAVIGKIKSKGLSFPSDLSPQYRSHLTSLTKKYSVDDTGNATSEYVKKESAHDHYLHSLNYAMIALGMLAGVGTNTDA